MSGNSDVAMRIGEVESDMTFCIWPAFSEN